MVNEMKDVRSMYLAWKKMDIAERNIFGAQTIEEFANKFEIGIDIVERWDDGENFILPDRANKEEYDQRVRDGQIKHPRKTV